MKPLSLIQQRADLLASIAAHDLALRAAMLDAKADALHEWHEATAALTFRSAVTAWPQLFLGGALCVGFFLGFSHARH